MNKAEDLWNILTWLGVERRSFYSFRNAYCTMGGFGGYKVIGYKNLDKISFTNAEVSDHGYGLEVNGKSLEDIISTALGTKVKGNGGYGSGLPSFSSNSCDVTVTINPHDKECDIETEDNVWHSVEEMEAEKSEQFQEENAEADPEK
jgi:hypothetical protein